MWNRPLPALRLLFEIVVLGAAAILIFFQPFDVTLFGGCLGTAVGAWVLLLVFSSRLRRFAAVVRAVEVVVFNLCTFAVLAEGGLLLAARWSGSPLLAVDVDESARVVTRCKLNHPAGQMRFGFPVNSQNHYDEELVRRPAGEPVVAMIGDSFSYGVVPHHYHFSTVCERRMKVAVYNFGYPSIGPHEYRQVLQAEVLKVAPDVIAVNLFIGNDIANANQVPPGPRRLDRWLDRRNLLIYQLPRRLGIFLAERRTARSAAPVGGIQGEGARRRLATVKEMTAVYPWLEDPLLEPPTISEDRFLLLEKSNAIAICDPRTADYSALFAVLRDIRRLAGETPLVVQLLPDEFQVNDVLWRQIRQAQGKRDLVRDLPQQILADWLDAEKIPYHDLLPVLRNRCACHSNGIRRCYHLRNTHFNARGNRVTGEAMARFFAPMVQGSH